MPAISATSRPDSERIRGIQSDDEMSIAMLPPRRACPERSRMGAGPSDGFLDSRLRGNDVTVVFGHALIP
jgi:hypothetical protein